MPDNQFPQAHVVSPPISSTKPSRSEMEDALLWAAEQLATHKPHRIVNCADPVDFELIRDNLEKVAKDILDPLIEAYGRYAAGYTYSIEVATFRNVVTNALDGNALYELEVAGEKMTEERREMRAAARSQGSFAGFR